MRDRSLKRFLVEDLEIGNGFCTVTGREAHHMSRVLRMGQGDALILLDGKGNRFLGDITSVSPNKVTLQIRKSYGPSAPPSMEINLCQAVIKSGPMDCLIQKASELGVTRILPFFSTRCVIHLSEEKREKKCCRWKEIANSAAKQSRRDVPARIHVPTPFEALLNRAGEISGLKMILWEKENSQNLKAVLRDHVPSKCVTGMVGPEGGFTTQEISRARQAGFMPVSLGGRILRAETAAMLLVAMIQYEWGDLDFVP